MKKEELYEVLSDINENYVQETRVQKSKTLRSVRVRWAALAACFIIIIFMAVRLVWQKTPDDGVSKLPMLTIAEDTSGGMGFEGYWAYDVSELINANPWSEVTELSSLPVFKNQLTYDENYRVSGGDFDAMETFLLDVAGRLGLDTDNLELTDNTPSEEQQAAILEKYNGNIPEGYFDPTEVILEADGMKISVDTAMTATIAFEPAIELPEEYNFTHYASYEDTAAVAGYLKETYKALIGIDNPEMNLHGGDYNIYLQQQYHIEFYDGSGETINQMINYNFNRVAFYCDDGKLFLARISQPDLSEKVGDYPVISVDEAEKLLQNGNYITTAPYEMPGLAHVKKVELIYRTGNSEEYFMPYYRFYVEVPDENWEEGLKTFGAYYVPAVENSYITNMPLWDGSFN